MLKILNSHRLAIRLKLQSLWSETTKRDKHVSLNVKCRSSGDKLTKHCALNNEHTINRDDISVRDETPLNECRSGSAMSEAVVRLRNPYSGVNRDSKLSEKCSQMVVDKSLLRKRGRYTPKEDHILTRNWESFCEKHSVSEHMKLHLLGFFTSSKTYTESMRKEIKILRKKENFLRHLTSGLPNRTLESIYDRARHLFCSLKRRRDFSAPEINTMVDMRYNLKYSWIRIAEITRCHPTAVKDIVVLNYANENKLYDKGFFTDDEDNRLLSALRNVFNSDNLRDKIFIEDIDWNEVQKVADINRHPKRCRERWMNTLRWKMIVDEDNEECKTIFVAELIYSLFKCNYHNEDDIDWHFIKKTVAKYNSVDTLRKSWRTLKSTVPDFESKSYKQIINYLYDNVYHEMVKRE